MNDYDATVLSYSASSTICAKEIFWSCGSWLRQEIMNDGRVKGKIPDIIRRYRDRGQFWQFIKHKFPTYRERREYIWQEIRPLIDYLEAQDRSPGVRPITEALVEFDSQHVNDAWQKALDRRVRDPEGAITATRCY
jgi:phage portal protein BeeE